MRRRSSQDRIRAELRFFIEHDDRLPKSEDVFVPARGLGIGIFVEGSVYITGDRETLTINLNSPDLLVLAVQKSDAEHIYRFPWSRVVGFELITNERDDARLRTILGLS